jgi:DNA polymerase I-like protein with 3'-5' exonuclease and polymerase domains
VEWIELNIVKAVGQIELNGVAINIQTLHDQQGAMLDRIKELETILHKMAGHEFDINSPQQLSAVLFDDLKIEPPIIHGEPQRGTGKEVLDALEGTHPIIENIKRYREVMKLYNDFVLKLPECISEDCRLHGNLNPMGTRSGRFSASGGFGKKGEKIKLNCQQLPKAKSYELEYQINLPDDCGLDPNGEYTTKELDKLYPEWQQYKN